MNSPDPFDLGFVGVQDLKDVFGDLVNKIQFAPVRMDIWLEMIEDAKCRLIDVAARNASMFTVKRIDK